jgi:hypothetical protein
MAVLDLWIRDQRLELYHARTFRLMLSTIDAGAKNLGELQDVTLSSVSDSDHLVYNNSTGVWENQPAGAGTGDVVGPTGATDEAIARYNTNTGKLLQNGVVTITDAGIMKNVSEIWLDSIGDYKIVKNGTSLEIWVQGVRVQSWG